MNWWATHQFITALIAQANDLPVAGTPAWCQLADGDPAKLLALAAAGEHAVLRWETAQEAAAEASKAIAASEDWPAFARCVRAGRGNAYVPRKEAAS
ncbi:hypothetical protein A5649_02675 [Mycolicibacter heraklionensis]|uniref:DUF2742 domain-containing protein n=1 Tax=Mycolicibacter heraklionensis TaxID=512402 RepID=A0AA91EXY4_9MYCO|nr:hypothetical protein A5649_02675 [Mycolicibacter heraklionensis]